jgi:UPF0716 protein FxsA
MFGILVLLFTIVPALEIYLLITIGGQIGGLNTIAVVVLTGIVGAALAKSQGLAIINKIQSDLAKGALPADQFMHGLLVFGGGLLLLTPGFLTDILGLSMVIPGTRHLLVGYVKVLIQKGIESGNVHFTSTTFSSDGEHFSSSTFSSNNSPFEQNPFEQLQEQMREQNPEIDGDVIEVDFVEKKNKDNEE